MGFSLTHAESEASTANSSGVFPMFSGKILCNLSKNQSYGHSSHLVICI